jgi:hypothetical protein
MLEQNSSIVITVQLHKSDQYPYEQNKEEKHVFMSVGVIMRCDIHLYQ